jgi:integrase/recombinase XerD
VFIVEGKGGHQRLVPVSHTFFDRRPLPQQRTTADASTERVFVALKGPTRGDALSSEGLDEMLTNVTRAGLLMTTRC